jgi:hypothetical protein
MLRLSAVGTRSDVGSRSAQGRVVSFFETERGYQPVEKGYRHVAMTLKMQEKMGYCSEPVPFFNSLLFNGKTGDAKVSRLIPAIEGDFEGDAGR